MGVALGISGGSGLGDIEYWVGVGLGICGGSGLGGFRVGMGSGLLGGSGRGLGQHANAHKVNYTVKVKTNEACAISW